MKYLIPLAVSIASVACQSAVAANLTITNDIPNHFGSGSKEVIAEINGVKAGEQHSVQKTTFAVTLPSTSALETLSLTLPAGKTGFADYTQKFDIPYYEKNADYYPSVVADDAVAKSVYDFVLDASVKTLKPELFRFNQRARVLFEERNVPGLTPIPQDALVAYWLVQSTAALVSKSRIEIDPVTSAAATKLAQWTAKDGKFEESFYSDKSRITHTMVADALNAVAERDGTIRARVITTLDNGTLTRTTRTDACGRLQSLRDVFEDEYDQNPDSGAAYSSWPYQYTLVIGSSIKCLYAQVADLKTQGAPIPTDVSDNVILELNKLGAALKLYQSGSAHSKEADAEIAKRTEAARQLAKITDVVLPEELATSP